MSSEFIRIRVIRMFTFGCNEPFEQENDEFEVLPINELSPYKITMDVKDWKRRSQALEGTITKAFNEILYFTGESLIEVPETTEFYIDFTQEELDTLQAGGGLIFSQLTCNQKTSIRGGSRP